MKNGTRFTNLSEVVSVRSSVVDSLRDEFKDYPERAPSMIGTSGEAKQPAMPVLHESTGTFKPASKPSS